MADVAEFIKFELLLDRASRRVFLFTEYDEQLKWSGQLISASQSLLANQYPSINAMEASNFIGTIWSFPIIRHSSAFSITLEELVIQINKKAEIRALAF